MNKDDYRRAIDQFSMDPEMKERIQRKVCPVSGVPSAPISRKRRPWKRIAAVAGAAALMTSLLVPAAYGYSNVVEMVAGWSQEQFWFQAAEPDLAESSLLVLPMDENGEFDLDTWLTENHVRENLLNLKLPDGFSFVESSVYPFDTAVSYDICYKREDEVIILSAYQSIASEGATYEKTDGFLECYSINGIDHYFFENTENTTAVWRVDRIEYSVVTSFPLEELKKLVESIYEE